MTSDYLEQYLWTEMRSDARDRGLTIAQDAESMLKDLIRELAQQFFRRPDAKAAARARLRRLCARMLVYAEKQGLKEINVAAVHDCLMMSASFRPVEIP
jgi:predicted DNA-binding ribbon-helix-helix protein